VNHSEIVSVLRGVADLIRDTFKRGKYQDVILPLTVLRRLERIPRDATRSPDGLGEISPITRERRLTAFHK
jgi:hypothetical protein